MDRSRMTARLCEAPMPLLSKKNVSWTEYSWIGGAMRAYRLHLGEEALVYRLAYNGDVVAFKMGRRRDPGWPSFDPFSQRVAR